MPPLTWVVMCLLRASDEAHGQAYEALSRVRSLQGVLLAALSRESFSLNSAVVHEEYVHLAGRPIQDFDMISSM